MKKFKIISLFAIIFISTILIVGCNTESNESEFKYYRITYHLDNGTNNSKNISLVMDTDSHEIVLYEPNKEGYSFLGWFLDADYTQKYTSRQIKQDIDVYAKFEINYYDVLIINEYYSPTPVSLHLPYNSEIDLNEYSVYRPGYNYKGWYLDSSSSPVSTQITVTQNMRLYCNYEAIFKTSNGIIYGFSSNYHSQSVTIPDEIDGVKITKIYNNAFKEQGIKDVTIGRNVEFIGAYAFYSSDSFKSITNISIPDNVEYIGDYAFANNLLRQISIGSSVKYIGDYAFYQVSAQPQNIEWKNADISKNVCIELITYKYVIKLKTPITIGNNIFFGLYKIIQP